jgi:lysophospholipase L1-like esterase
MKNFLRSLGFSLATATLLHAGHSAIDPQPRPDKWWQERQESLNKRVAEAGPKAAVVFIGDSITQGWEDEGKGVWTRYYAHRDAVNLGISGDRTQHVLWRLDNGNLQGLRPKAAVVMIGTNNSNGEDNTAGQIVDGVAGIVRKLRSALPGTKVLLLAIFPRSENFAPQRGKLAMINQALRRLADDKDVFWADFGHLFLNDDGSIPRELMPDYLHLSPKGYGIWAEAIEDRLASLVGDTRVAPAAVASAGLAGNWIWTINGPNGEPVSSPLVIRVDGRKVVARFTRGPDRWLESENGTVDGTSFSWIVKRDRPDGGSMTYEMSGTVDGDAIKGVAKTDFNGPQTLEWTARRK